MTNWETIAQTDDFVIDYDKERAMYRVSYFQDNHFVDDVMFDAYESVVHGEWVYDHWCEFKCSECGQFSDSKPFKGKERYCPNCGARMDGGNVND